MQIKHYEQKGEPHSPRSDAIQRRVCLGSSLFVYRMFYLVLG